MPPKGGRVKNDDPNAPKKPPSAYMAWLTKVRTRIAEEVGSARVSDVMKVASVRWKALPEEKRARLMANAKQARAAWKQELAAYEASRTRTHWVDGADADAAVDSVAAAAPGDVRLEGKAVPDLKDVPSEALLAELSRRLKAFEQPIVEVGATAKPRSANATAACLDTPVVTTPAAKQQRTAKAMGNAVGESPLLEKADGVENAAGQIEKQHLKKKGANGIALSESTLLEDGVERAVVVARKQRIRQESAKRSERTSPNEAVDTGAVAAVEENVQASQAPKGARGGLHTTENIFTAGFRVWLAKRALQIEADLGPGGSVRKEGKRRWALLSAAKRAKWDCRADASSS
mmetsp:Transcript_108084/g.304457  ORF Transcript_108084/g.304457 Transcript_108084/m.304457 type:complete len:347 (-) Transcript_108084:89-1129(-)